MALTTDLRDAYSATGNEWQKGPGRIYERLAEVLVAASPVPVPGSSVADIGAGTGAGGRAARRAGAASVVALDVAFGMLQADPDGTPAVVADARVLPLRAGCVDIGLAAFSLNHLADPAAGLREAARIVRPGGAVVAGAYAADDTHPVKDAVEAVLRRHGWRPPDWVDWMRAEAVPRLASVDGATAAARAAGLVRGAVDHVGVPFPDLSVEALVAWRLGMAQHAPFVATLDARTRESIQELVVHELGQSPPTLVRQVVVLTCSV